LKAGTLSVFIGIINKRRFRPKIVGEKAGAALLTEKPGKIFQFGLSAIIIVLLGANCDSEMKINHNAKLIIKDGKASI